jgi:hypothetical protein
MEHLPFDDYTIDSTVLLLGSFCNIQSPQGTFATALSRGKMTPDVLFHVLEGTCEQETRYLRHAMAAMPAAHYLKGTNISQRFDLEGLSQVRIPYPLLGQRLMFTWVMDTIEQEFANTIQETSALLAFGDDLFGQAASASHVRLSERAGFSPGSYLPFEAGFRSGKPPVVSARGVIGAAFEPLADGEALVLGNLGDRLSVQYFDEPSAPNSETVYLSASASRLPLAVLFFALRDAGAVTNAAEADTGRVRRGLSLDSLGQIELRLVDDEACVDFGGRVATILRSVSALRQRLDCLRELRRALGEALIRNTLPKQFSWKETGERKHSKSQTKGADTVRKAVGNPKPQETQEMQYAGETQEAAADEKTPLELAALPDSVLDLVFGIFGQAVEKGVSPERLRICCPPPNQGQWANVLPRVEDPCWVFGPPPQNHANYAWIQQAIAAMQPESQTVLLLCNDALQTENPAERPLREAFAASGLLKAVIALPGRIFLDARPPSSLVVLEKSACPQTQTLFIDLQESGVEHVSDGSGENRSALGARDNFRMRTSPQQQAIPGADLEAASEYAGRTVPPEVVAWTLEHYRHFDSFPLSLAVEPGYSAIAGVEDLKANGWLLTSWTYVHPRVSKDECLMRPSAQALMTYVQSRKTVQQELDNYLSEKYLGESIRQ